MASSPSGSKSPTIKIEEDVITQFDLKYMCGECSKAFSTLRGLAVHFASLHRSHLVPCHIPGCRQLFIDELGATCHYNRFHQGQYPCQFEDCLLRFKSSALLKKHLENHPDRGPRSYRKFNCPVVDCGRAFTSQEGLKNHQSTTHEVPCRFGKCRQRFMSTEEREQHVVTEHSASFERGVHSCPQVGCMRTFPELDPLYEHFLSAKHSLYNEGKNPNAFKCAFDFCPSAFPAEDQIKLHHAIVHKSKRADSEPSNPLDPAHFSLRQISNIPGTPNNPRPEREEGDASVRHGSSQSGDSWDNAIEITEDGMIFLSNPEASKGTEETGEGEKLDVLGKDCTPTLQSNEAPGQKMAIGYLLRTSLLDRNLPLQSSDNDYPDYAALDEHEKDSGNDGDEDMNDSSDEFLLPKIFQQVLGLLNIEELVTIYELIELWAVFLNAEQREVIVWQLKRLNLDDNLQAPPVELVNSALVSLILAWVNFKLLLLNAPQQLGTAHNTARGVAWTVLKHCMILEEMRRRALPTAISVGLDIPDQLREPTKGFDFSPDEPLSNILEALAERAKCRKVIPQWLQLTNMMVLEQMLEYFRELREVVAVIYPGMQDSPEWLESYGPP